jgi:uncharacterized protein (TIGR03067 family)
MNPHAAVLTLVGVMLVGAGGQDEAVKKELARMQGVWKTVSVEINGQAVPEEEFKDDRLTIRDGAFVLRAGKSSTAGTLTLDPTKQPRTIDTETVLGKDKGIKSLGIYQLEGNTLKVCYVVHPNPRPTEFKTMPKSGRALVVYQKIAAKEK